jgi:Double zinc ribbon
MVFCPKCHTQIVEDARFCHHCGTNIEIPLAECPTCLHKNPADTKFCFSCGDPMRAIPLRKYDDSRSKYDFQHLDVLEEEIKVLFFEELKRLATLVNPNRMEDYLREVYLQNYTMTIARRAEHLSEEFAELNYRQALPSVMALEKLLENSVSTLALNHIIYNCRDLNPLFLSPRIMLHERATVGKFNVQDLIFDYLDFPSEKERIYVDFLRMPFNTLQNAAKHFVFAAKDEYIYFISDQTILGSGKEGFAMTEFGLYWKSPMEKPKKVYYHHLARLERKKSGIYINGHYFSVNPTVNIKMLLLLEKMKTIYA